MIIKVMVAKVMFLGFVVIVAVAGLGVATLLIMGGESRAELDGSSLPPLVVEG